jgi:ribosomal protein S18 acetylase RimI-like enzyme
MLIRNAREADFMSCVAIARSAWPEFNERESIYHIFCRFFSNTSFVCEQDAKIQGFLLGFQSQVDPTQAYIHLVAVDPQFQRQGFAKQLYQKFFDTAAGLGAREVRAIVNPDNAVSLAFHDKFGFHRDLHGETIQVQGVAAARDYNGPGIHMVPMVRLLPRTRTLVKIWRKGFIAFLQWASDFLRRSIPADPHVWAALVAAIIIIVLDLTGMLPGEPSQRILIVVTIFFIFLVCDRLKEANEARTITRKLETLHQSTFDKRVALCPCPSTANPTEYRYLWGGYTGTYDVYNPSYRVDRETGEDNVVEILLQRYRDKKFLLARYIFLTKGDEQDLTTFRRLMARVKHDYPQVVDKIRVKVRRDQEPSSAAEMYMGDRDQMRNAVVELKDPVLGPHRGMPLYYLLIHDESVLEHLQTHFNAAWNDSDTNNEEIDIFNVEGI